MHNACKCCAGSCGCGKWGCACSGYVSLIARVLLGLLFLVVGFEKIMNFGVTVSAIAAVGAHYPSFIAVVAIILEFGGAALLILGYQARLAAWGLILFTAVATLMYHRDTTQSLQVLMLLKNLSIMGGLLMVVAHGPGKFSLRCCCGGSKCLDCGAGACECKKTDVAGLRQN